MTPNVLEEIRGLICDYDNIYITSHINPDGDAVGACFGLGLALEKLGKNVQVMLEPYQSRFDIIPGRHLLGDKMFAGDSILICLDCADVNRLIQGGRAVAATVNIVVNIDHHYTNTNFANINYVDGNASSTCEMVYRLLDTFVEADRNIASALYAGMVSDTGGFRFSSVSEDTLAITAKLVALDIPFTDIYVELMHKRSFTELKLMGRVLDSAQLSDDGRIIHVCVSQAMMKGFKGAPDAESRDAEGLVEFMLNVSGVEIAVLLYEKENGEIKVSLRSRSANVGDVAVKLGGGGHHLAAGANVTGDIYGIREQVLSLL